MTNQNSVATKWSSTCGRASSRPEFCWSLKISGRVSGGHLRTLKKSGSIVYELTDKGKTLLPTLEQKPLPEGRKPLREIKPGQLVACHLR